jgi:hypothetical protein
MNAVRIAEWRPLHRNTLRGFAIVELPSGMIIRDVSVHEKNGKRWVAPPGKPMIDGNGRHLENSVGQKQYSPIISFRDKATSARFSEVVLDAIRQAGHQLDEEPARPPPPDAPWLAPNARF